jgi:hypothetical protein
MKRKESDTQYSVAVKAAAKPRLGIHEWRKRLEEQPLETPLLVPTSTDQSKASPVHTPSFIELKPVDASMEEVKPAHTIELKTVNVEVVPDLKTSLEKINVGDCVAMKRHTGDKTEPWDKIKPAAEVNLDDFLI